MLMIAFISGHALGQLSVPPKLVILSLAADGLSVQSSLFSWSKETAWSISQPYEDKDSSHNHVYDSPSLLANIYYHATSIFLSGIFDYRYHHWEGIPTPRLPAVDIQKTMSPQSSMAQRPHSIRQILRAFYFSSHYASQLREPGQRQSSRRY